MITHTKWNCVVEDKLCHIPFRMNPENKVPNLSKWKTLECCRKFAEGLD